MREAWLLPRFPQRWRARQREAVEAERQGGNRGHEERLAEQAPCDAVMRIPGEAVTDQEPRDDPADRAPQANAAEVAGGRGPLAGGEGVEQRRPGDVEKN